MKALLQVKTSCLQSAGVGPRGFGAGVEPVRAADLGVASMASTENARLFFLAFILLSVYEGIKAGM